MSYPQIIWFVLVGISFGVDCSRHGQAKTGRYNAWLTIVSIALNYWLLSAGGFFGGIAG